MIKLTFAKEILLQTTAIACMLMVVSCTDNQNTKDTKTTAEELNEERFDDNRQEKDAQFVVNASEINLQEIQLGKLAQQKGQTAHVKDLGKMMEDVHTKSQRELVTLAENKRISIPTSPTNNAKDAYDKLNGKSGDDFDNEYTDMMVSGHKDAISIYEKAASDSQDADIRNWSQATLSTLRTHLDHSLESQRKVSDASSKKRN